MTTFCPRCGTRRAGAFRYCRSCGFDLEAGTPTASAPEPPPPAVGPAPPAPRSSSKALGGALLLVVVGLALANTMGVFRSTGSTPTSQPTAGPTHQPTAALTEPVTRTKTLSDAKRDLLDNDGRSASGPSYIDVVQLVASTDGTNLTLEATMMAAVPPQSSSLDEEINYEFVIAVDGHPDPEYYVEVQNREAGLWGVDLWDRRASHTYNDNAFPGTFRVTGPTIVATVSLTAIGDPETIAVAMYTQRAAVPSGDLTAQDNAPDGPEYQPSAQWLHLP